MVDAVKIREEPIGNLALHADVPIAFVVERVLDVEQIRGGLGGVSLTERVLDAPWTKDYDSIKGEGPTRWAKRFDVSTWGLLAGCVTLVVETQNVNVPACRFYRRMGCELGAIDRHTYPAFPDEVRLIWSTAVSGSHLVLVGLMGAGKTTVGEQCARLLDRPFVDTDDLVEATTHATVAEIFEQFGEAHFRELERQAIADVTSSPAPLVIACGGGAVTDPGSRRALHDAGVVVWLQAPTSVLEERVGTGTTRPLLREGAAPTLERLAAEREAMYGAIADATVDTNGRSAEEVADAVLAAAEESDRWSG